MNEQQTIIAYSLTAGGVTIYEHAGCFELLSKRNINNLTPEEMKQTESAYTPLTADMIPDNPVCQDCKKPIFRR